MRPLIRYISPLLLCGLMFSFFHNNPRTTSKCSQPAVGQRNGAGSQNIFISCANGGSFIKKIATMKSTQQQAHPNENGFSFFKDVIANIVPALKNIK